MKQGVFSRIKTAVVILVSFSSYAAAEVRYLVTDLVVVLRDLTRPEEAVPKEWIQSASQVITVWNKVDVASPNHDLCVSAITGEGIAGLIDRLVESLGFQPDGSAFTARQRHVDALDRASRALADAGALVQTGGQVELIAEDIRQAHRYLGEIVGEVTTDALLGEIFSTFCIGK